MILRLPAVCIAALYLPSIAAAEDVPLPAAPENLVELTWSSHFAAFIATECVQFELEDASNPRVTAFMEKMLQDGVDLENHETDDADLADFDGDSVPWLFSRSNLAEWKAPDGASFCDIAEFVYESDMLTGAMLRRVEPEGSS